MQREFGICHFDYLIMARLSEAHGSTLRMSVLATLAGSSLSRLSQAVRRREKARLDITSSRRRGRRYTLAVFSSAALRCLQEAAPSHVEAVR